MTKSTRESLDFWIHCNNMPINTVIFDDDDNVMVTDKVIEKVTEMQTEIDELKAKMKELNDKAFDEKD